MPFTRREGYITQTTASGEPLPYFPQYSDKNKIISKERLTITLDTIQPTLHRLGIHLHSLFCGTIPKTSTLYSGNQLIKKITFGTPSIELALQKHIDLEQVVIIDLGDKKTNWFIELLTIIYSTSRETVGTIEHNDRRFRIIKMVGLTRSPDYFLLEINEQQRLSNLQFDTFTELYLHAVESLEYTPILPNFLIDKKEEVNMLKGEGDAANPNTNNFWWHNN